MFGVSRKEFYEVLGRLDALRYDLENLGSQVKATRDGHYAAIREVQGQLYQMMDGLTNAGVMHYEGAGWRKGPAKKAK